jgi:hypothetical protein
MMLNSLIFAAWPQWARVCFPAQPDWQAEWLRLMLRGR